MKFLSKILTRALKCKPSAKNNKLAIIQDNYAYDVLITKGHRSIGVVWRLAWVYIYI